MFVRRKSLYIVNPRTFTNPILPHSIQSKRKTYDVEKIAPVFGCQWIVRMSECVFKKTMDLTVCLALKAALNSTTTLSY